MNKIFISYNWESKSAVDQICELLESKNGYQICLNQSETNAVDLLHGEVQAAIANCKLFVAFITQNYFETKNCCFEINHASVENKPSIYVMFENDLDSFPPGIKLLLFGSLRINAFDLMNHDNWPVNLYDNLSVEINKRLPDKESLNLINLKKIIICGTCKNIFNLEDNGKENCRNPMQTNCNLNDTHKNVLCLRCLKDRKRINGTKNESFLCPFDKNEHLLSNCTEAKRLLNVIRYFEVIDSLDHLKSDASRYNNLKDKTSNRIITQVNENKMKIKDHVVEIKKELDDYVSEVVEKLDKHVDEWRVKQENINESIKIDEIIKSIGNSISQLENDLKLIEIAVDRNISSLNDLENNVNSAKIMNINDTITKLNDQLIQELNKLNDEMSLSFKKETKIIDFKQTIGTLEETRVGVNTPPIEVLSVKKNNNYVQVKALVEQQNTKNNIKIGCDDQNSLIQECHYGHIDKVKFLIEHGAKVNKMDNQGCTGLMLAARKDHFKIVELLLQNGANINEKDDEDDSVLICASEKGHLRTVELLIQKGANINETNIYGHNSLMKATGFIKVVDLLVKNGALVNEKDNCGYTALIRALRFGHLNTVKLLIANGASINEKDNEGWTALMWASEYYRLQTMRMLVNNGVNIDEKNNTGSTALIEISKRDCLHRKNFQMAQLLIDNGASVNKKDKKGRTALTWALEKGKTKLVEYLIENGASNSGKRKSKKNYDVKAKKQRTDYPIK